MATVVELPPSALPSAIQRLPRRASIEVIDVEEYLQQSEAGVGSSSQPSRPAPRPIQRTTTTQPETIYIDSDDDEPIIMSSRVLSGHDTNRQRSHRRLISPPPRSASGSAPPPVPPIPRLYAGFVGFPPMRRNPPNFPRPPVIPSPEPLDLESFFDQPVVAGPGPTSRSVSFHRSLTPPASRPSHHVPSMGLGGALISSNNARARQEAQDARLAARLARQRQAIRLHAVRSMRQQLILHNQDEDERAMVRSVWGMNYMPSFGSWSRVAGSKAGKEREPYDPSYTHPLQPEPGFTFDFSIASEDDDRPRRPNFPATSINAPIVIDDDDEPSTSNTPIIIDLDEGLTTAAAGSSSGATSASASSSKAAASSRGELTALLVCARCLDPLILNAAMDATEDQYRRVWALRCGHMIDEKCLNEIGQPPEVFSLENGKEKEQELPLKVDKKGKGKAKVTRRATYGDAVPEVKEADEGNMRARLRSHNTTTTSSSATATTSATSSTPTSSSSAPLPTNRAATKRRRVASSKSRRRPQVEDEYEWTCPVASCERIHASVKIDGIWGPEKEGSIGPTGAMLAVQEGREIVPRGVIAVFA